MRICFAKNEYAREGEGKGTFHTSFPNSVGVFEPETILLLTWKVNFRLYRLPSFRVNYKPLGLPDSGTGRKISGLSGNFIARLKNLTFGSQVSTNI